MRVSDAHIMAGLSVIVFLFVSPMLFPLNSIYLEESYLYFAALQDISVIHLKQDHLLPLWAFHFGGGYPLIKHSESLSLSPLFYLFMLPFGTAIGIKFFILSSFVVGAIGFYLFMRRIICLQQAGSTIASLIFSLLSYIPYHVNTGNIRDIGWFYLPLLTYFVVRTKEKRAYVICSAVVISLLILNGFSIYILPLVLFLMLFVLLDTLKQPKHRLLNKKPLVGPFIFILLLAFPLSAAKLFPALDLLRTADRSIDSYEEASNNAMTFHKLGLALFSRGPYAVGNEAVVGPHVRGPGAVMYIGAIPALVFVLALVFHFRKLWPFLLVMAVFIALSMAENSPVDLFRMLWHLPLFHSMREPARYFMFPAVFMMSNIVGGFLSSSFFRRIRPRAKWVIYGIMIIAVADMFISNTQDFVFTGRALHQVKDCL